MLPARVRAFDDSRRHLRPGTISVAMLDVPELTIADRNVTPAGTWVAQL